MIHGGAYPPPFRWGRAGWGPTESLASLARMNRPVVGLVALLAGSAAGCAADLPEATLPSSPIPAVPCPVAPPAAPGSQASADASPSTLAGYAPSSAPGELAWEQKLRAIPDPARMRDYMQRLSARPHHVGSPYDRDNAEWILARFKEAGLDAHIETFERALSHAEEARARDGRAREFHGEARGARGQGRPHLRPARRATAHVQRVLDRWRRHRAAGLRRTTAYRRTTRSSTAWACP